MNEIRQSNFCKICASRYSEDNYPVCLPCGHVLCCQCQTQIEQVAGKRLRVAELAFMSSYTFLSIYLDATCIWFFVTLISQVNCPECRAPHNRGSAVRRIYNEAPDDEEHVGYRKMSNIQVFVRGINNRTMTIEINPADTILHLKEILFVSFNHFNEVFYPNIQEKIGCESRRATLSWARKAS